MILSFFIVYSIPLLAPFSVDWMSRKRHLWRGLWYFRMFIWFGRLLLARGVWGIPSLKLCSQLVCLLFYTYVMSMLCAVERVAIFSLEYWDQHKRKQEWVAPPPCICDWSWNVSYFLFVSVTSFCPSSFLLFQNFWRYWLLHTKSTKKSVTFAGNNKVHINIRCPWPWGAIVKI